MPMTCGAADTNCMLPVAAGVMLIVVVELTPPAEALIATDPALLRAENAVVALPPTVDPETFERLPKVPSLRIKVTIVPSGTGCPAPVTVAVSVVVPNTVMDAGFEIKVTVSGGGAEIVIVEVPVRLLGAYEAVTVTGVTMFFAVSVMVATPPASVMAVADESVAAAGLLMVKVTVRPGPTGLMPLNTALMFVVPFVKMDEAVADMVMEGTAEVGLIVTFA